MSVQNKTQIRVYVAYASPIDNLYHQFADFRGNTDGK